MNRLGICIAASMVAGLVGCGGQTTSGGGSPRDGAADQLSPGQDSGGGADTGSDTGGSSSDASLDGGGPQDAAGDVGKPPYDGGPFANCGTNPCGRGQVCTNYLATNDASAGIQYGDCEPVAAMCEPAPTCFCLLETAMCSNRECNDDAGVPVLTCTIPPHP
jgi:hypothetical protein